MIKKTIRFVLSNINETIKLWIEMQREFGERRNYKGIKRRMREYILVADSGYFTTENLYYLIINKINALIMPKTLSKEHNNKLRRENDLEEKRKNSTRKGLKRVKNGYKYPHGRLIKFIKSIKINHRKPHKDDDLPDICKTKRFIIESHSCKGYPNVDNCKNKKLTDKISDLIFDITEKFLDKRRNIHYKFRFSRSEGINGFLKGDDGVLKLIATTETAINNEIQLRNTIYNLTRLINLKNTAY